MPSLKGAWPALNSLPILTETPALQKLRALQNRIDPADSEAFAEILMQEATHRVKRFIAGVRAYRHHPVCRSVSDAPVIWKAGSACLRDYNPSQPDAPIIFVVPSLINRFDILDLDHDHSFLRWLTAQGFRPLVMDWGAPGEDEQNFTLTDYIATYLVAALETITASFQAPVHVLGYCMGGLLALALATLKPQRVRTLTLMATPWDFHQPSPALAADYVTLAQQLESHLVQTHQLPVDIIQGLFAMLQPFKVMTKFAAFADVDPDPNSFTARRFVLLEDWLNDGVALTANVARECLVGWYGHNDTAQGRWRINGQVIDPRNLNIPCCIIVPGKDRIVPPQSALPLVQILPRATLHQPMMGHIGLIASERAPEEVWMPLAAWLQQNA